VTMGTGANKHITCRDKDFACARRCKRMSGNEIRPLG
jgi:hypothetical protein